MLRNSVPDRIFLNLWKLTLNFAKDTRTLAACFITTEELPHLISHSSVRSLVRASSSPKQWWDRVCILKFRVTCEFQQSPAAAESVYSKHRLKFWCVEICRICWRDQLSQDPLLPELSKGTAPPPPPPLGLVGIWELLKLDEMREIGSIAFTSFAHEWDGVHSFHQLLTGVHNLRCRDFCFR